MGYIEQLFDSLKNSNFEIEEEAFPVNTRSIILNSKMYQ